MFYSRKMLENDERRQQIAEELKGVTWEMRIRYVAETYVFFEHPDFKDHVFCSTSIIAYRPLEIGDMMNVQVELAFDNARNCYGYVAKSAMRPQDNLYGNKYKSDFENLSSVMQKLMLRSRNIKTEEEWKSLLPAGWDWTVDFVEEHAEELQWISNMLVQCGALSRLHGAPKLVTVEGIREILARYPHELHALEYEFEKALLKTGKPVGHLPHRRRGK